MSITIKQILNTSTPYITVDGSDPLFKPLGLPAPDWFLVGNSGVYSKQPQLYSETDWTLYVKDILSTAHFSGGLISSDLVDSVKYYYKKLIESDDVITETQDSGNIVCSALWDLQDGTHLFLSMDQIDDTLTSYMSNVPYNEQFEHANYNAKEPVVLDWGDTQKFEKTVNTLKIFEQQNTLYQSVEQASLKAHTAVKRKI